MKDIKYVILIGAILVGTIVFQEYKVVQLNAKLESNTVNVDSLQNELFIKQAEVGRYEMALDIFKEEDSVGADHFEYILNTQTEQL